MKSPTPCALGGLFVPKDLRDVDFAGDSGKNYGSIFRKFEFQTLAERYARLGLQGGGAWGVGEAGAGAGAEAGASGMLSGGAWGAGGGGSAKKGGPRCAEKDALIQINICILKFLFLSLQSTHHTFI